jgi:hypothetical protein
VLVSDETRVYTVLSALKVNLIGVLITEYSFWNLIIDKISFLIVKEQGAAILALESVTQ